MNHFPSLMTSSLGIGKACDGDKVAPGGQADHLKFAFACLVKDEQRWPTQGCGR